MDNPWRAFPHIGEDPLPMDREEEHVLPADRQALLEHNRRLANDTYRIRWEVLPLPYLGRPDAPVVLLNLNPGYSDEDIEFYSQEKVRGLWKRNLLHEDLEYPFWLLDPRLLQNDGACWWRDKLRFLIEVASLRRVANRIFCIELFPYPSRKYHRMKSDHPLVSQEYSFYLVRQAMRNGAIVVVLRSYDLWKKEVPGLAGYSLCYPLKNPQNVVLTPGNCPGGFEVIEKAVCI